MFSVLFYRNEMTEPFFLYCLCIMSQSFLMTGVKKTFLCMSLVMFTKKVLHFCVFLSISLSVGRMTQKVVDEFWWNFGGAGCVTSNSWLDFGGDRDHDADTGIFEWNIYHCGVWAIQQILLTIEEVLNKFLWNFLRGGMSVVCECFY